MSSSLKFIFSAAVLMIQFLWISLGAGAQPTLTVVSPQKTLYEKKTSGCRPEFIPDSPARAFRRADGNIALVAAHYVDWIMLGPDWYHLKPVTQSIFDTSYYQKFYRGYMWIQALFTEDGKSIYGLASNDLSTATVACGCKPTQPGRCWVNQMVSVKSADMGNHFMPGTVVASYTDIYPDTENSQFGFFSASNIVKKDGFYYVIIFQSPPKSAALARGMRSSGNCLFRTDTITTSRRWRGLTANGFDYIADKSNGDCQMLTPPDIGPIRSIAYLKKTNMWIGMTAGRHQLPGDSQPVPGFYSLTSPDLIHWTNLQRVISLPMAPRKDSMTDIYSYPSLIDPESASKNFESLDHDKAILLFTDHHLRNGTGTLDRDLKYVIVDIRAN